MKDKIVTLASLQKFKEKQDALINAFVTALENSISAGDQSLTDFLNELKGQLLGLDEELDDYKEEVDTNYVSTNLDKDWWKTHFHISDYVKFANLKDAEEIKNLKEKTDFFRAETIDGKDVIVIDDGKYLRGQIEGYATLSQFENEFSSINNTLSNKLNLNDVSITNGVIKIKDNTLTPLTSHLTKGEIEALNLDYSKLGNKPTLLTIENVKADSSIKDLIDNKDKYLTEHQSLSNYAQKEDVDTKITQFSQSSVFGDKVILNLKDKELLNNNGKIIYSSIDGTPTSLPASDVPNWAKEQNKPTYTAAEVGARPDNWKPSEEDLPNINISKINNLQNTLNTIPTINEQKTKITFPGNKVLSIEGLATENFVTSKGYQTSSDVETAITSKGYQTSANVIATLKDKNILNSYGNLSISKESITGLGALASLDSLSASDVGARPNTWTPSAADVGVPEWARAETKPHYTASEVGARSSSWMPTAAQVGAKPSSYVPTATEVADVLSDAITTSNNSILRNKLGLGALATKENIQESDLPTISISKINNLQTTLNTIPSVNNAGTEISFGNKKVIILTQSNVDDAITSKVKINDGVIYINGNTIAPITSHLTKSDIENLGIDYSKLGNKPTIPTKVSQLTNDSGFTTFDGNYNSLSNKPTLITSYNDLTDKPNLFDGKYSSLSGKPNIPTKVSDLSNDSGFLTEHQDLSSYTKTTDLESVMTTKGFSKLTTSDIDTRISNKVTLLNGVITINGSSITPITEHQDLSGYQTKITSSNKLNYNLLTNVPTTLTNEEISELQALKETVNFLVADLNANDSTGTKINSLNNHLSSASNLSGHNWRYQVSNSDIILIDSIQHD